MTGECQSCPECKAHIKIASKIKDQIYDHEELKTDFKEHKKMIWVEMNKRLSAGLFKWISGFLIAFCIGCGGLQMKMLAQIGELKMDIAVIQALIEKTNSSSDVFFKEKIGGE